MLKSLLNNLVLYHDYRSGTFRDWSGKGNDGTPTNVVWNEDGVEFNTNATSKIAVAANASLNITTGTVVVFGSFNTQNNNDRILSKREASSDWELLARTSDIAFAGTVYVTSIIGRKYIGIDFENGAVGNFSFDGAAMVDGTGNVTIGSNNAALTIGNFYTGLFAYNNAPISGVLIFDKKLTNAEHAALYAKLLQNRWKKKLYCQKKADTTIVPARGLVAGWEGEISGSTVADKIGSNNLTKVGMCSVAETLIGQTFDFDTTGNFSCANNAALNPTGDATLSAWFKFDTIPATSSYLIVHAKITSPYNGYFLRYIIGGTNGWQGTFVNSAGAIELVSGDRFAYPKKWYHVVLRKSGGVIDLFVDGEKQSTPAASTGATPYGTATFQIGDGGINNRFTGKIGKVELRNVAMTDAEIQADYLKVAKAVQFKTSWAPRLSMTTVSSGDVENSGFRVATGAWSVAGSTIKGSYVKTLKPTTGGVVSLPTSMLSEEGESAFGTWEFWLNKTGASSIIDMMFIADTVGGADAVGQDGYGVRFGSDETIALVKSTSGTPAAMITTAAKSLDTWYKVKITRNDAGVFKMWVDDVYVGTSTDRTIAYNYTIAIAAGAGDQIALSDISGDYSFTKYLGVV